MNTTSKTIVFFGSGPVAAASLKAAAEHFEIEAVVTKPVTQTEMQAAAPEAKLYPVANRAELTDLISKKPFSSQVGVVVDFGIIVDQAVIDYFPLGIINSHFSLLPQWRGADPITFTVLSGQDKTGVSLMQIVEALDEGPLLAQEELSVKPDATTPELTEELIKLSNHMLAKTLPEYIAGQLEPKPQPDEPATYSRKLTKEDGVLDWQKPAVQLEREIRAYIDWPKSRTTLAGKDVVITKAHIVETAGKPGQPAINGKQLVIVCGQGGLAIDKLKPAGKAEMSAEAFLAGYRNRF